MFVQNAVTNDISLAWTAKMRWIKIAVIFVWID